MKNKTRPTHRTLSIYLSVCTPVSLRLCAQDPCVTQLLVANFNSGKFFQ